MRNLKNNKNQGFTLIEMMVAVALFAMIMAIGAGSILSIINGNRKAQALSSVVNNLNFAVESMVRDIKTGSIYDCTNDPSHSNYLPTDCSTGGTSLIISSVLNNGQVIYSFTTTTVNGVTTGHITRTLTPNDHSIATSVLNINSDEVNITNLKFYVSGATPGSPDNAQPKVLIIIQGKAGTAQTASTFNIETLVSQRSLDI